MPDLPPLPETRRLTLRRFTPDDLPWLSDLNADASVMRYTNGAITPEQTREALIDRMLPYYEQHPGLGSWVTIEKDSGAVTGFHILNHIRGETLVQVGYRLFPAYWGLGYATEMTIGLLRYGFAGLQLPHICAITDRDHVVSMRVLEKAGLPRNGERAFAHPSYQASNPLAWFECRREDWLARFPEPADGRR